MSPWPGTNPGGRTSTTRVEKIHAVGGGVEFSGEFFLCYRANPESRIASRVLWQVATDRYRNEEDIYRVTYGLPWTDWFDRPVPLAEVVAANAARQKPKVPLAIYGSDLSGDVLKAARANLSAAGLEKLVSLKRANVLEISAPANEGIIVTNPPYGVRLGEQQELAEFYPKLGRVTGEP